MGTFDTQLNEPVANVYRQELRSEEKHIFCLEERVQNHKSGEQFGSHITGHSWPHYRAFLGGELSFHCMF